MDKLQKVKEIFESLDRGTSGRLIIESYQEEELRKIFNSTLTINEVQNYMRETFSKYIHPNNITDTLYYMKVQHIKDTKDYFISYGIDSNDDCLRLKSLKEVADNLEYEWRSTCC